MTGHGVPVFGGWFEIMICVRSGSCLPLMEALHIEGEGEGGGGCSICVLHKFKWWMGWDEMGLVVPGYA